LVLAPLFNARANNIERLEYPGLADLEAKCKWFMSPANASKPRKLALDVRAPLFAAGAVRLKSLIMAPFE
jgi:hypothetical protein